MLEMRPICERCNSPLPHEAQAFICSYECTFCAGCVTELGAVCPNCGGELVRRPIRPAHLLTVDPPSTKRFVRPGCAPASAR